MDRTLCDSAIHRSEYRQQRDSLQRWHADDVNSTGIHSECAPLSYIHELVNIYLARLPGHPDSGISTYPLAERLC